MSELLCAEFGTKGWIDVSGISPPVTAFVEWLCTKRYDCTAHNKGDIWQASMICCNTGCSGYWRPINRDCEKHGLRLRDCWQCENEAELLAATSLVDGAYSVVELWAAESPAQIAWKKWWLDTARAIGASAD